MQSFSELEEAIAAGPEGFNSFISAEMSADEHFLRRRFSFKKNKQITVLNYLIYKHQTGFGKPKMRKHIEMLLNKGADFNSDCSIHLLLRLKKLELFSLFLPRPASERVEAES